ncbi:Hpt domain-containing protein [Hydrogenimonas sp.]
MLIYRNDGKLFCISKKALQLAGYHDIEHFNAEHNDYSELFVKRPGYIYNFENFSWLSFLRNANAEQKRVLISTKDNATYECELAMETVFPVEFDENTPEFFYQIEFKNLKLSNGSAPLDEPLISSAEEVAFEEKILEDAYDANAPHPHATSPFEPEEEEEKPLHFGGDETEETEEERTFEFGIATESAPEIPETSATEELDKPLDLVDFEFGSEETKEKEEQKPLFSEPSEESVAKEETPPEIEIALKVESAPSPVQSEAIASEVRDEPESASLDIFTKSEPEDVPPAAPTTSEETSIEMPDIAKVSSTLGLPETMVRAFVKEFVTTYMNDLPEVKAAMASKNMHIAKKEAMKLKGIAANLRMEPLTQTLESVLKTKEDAKIQSIWNEIDAYMHNLASLYAPELAANVEEKAPSAEKEAPQAFFEPVEESSSEPVSEAKREEERPSPTGRKALKLEEKDTGETIIFDPNEAADALGLPESLILEFVNDFIEQAREEMKVFEEAYDKGDITTINEVAHKLKGVAANLRIEDMRQLMENVQHADSPEKVEKELIDFYHKLAALTNMMAKEYA